jgi:hypothetical protein
MRPIIVTVLAITLAFAGASLAPSSVEAGWVDGWYTFAGTSTTSRSFSDRTPGKTALVLYLQKKAGSTVKCRAQVIVRSGGDSWRSRPVYKYTRVQTRGYVGVIDWSNSVVTKTLTVRTNGSCLFRVYAR